MAARTSQTQAKPVLLVHGDDEYSVMSCARDRFRQWCDEIGGEGHETLSGVATNQDEAVRTIARLRESLQSLSLFGNGKVVWLQNCNFLGDERTASGQEVTKTLTALGEFLSGFRWGNERLILTTPKIDKRRSFYKVISKIATVQEFKQLTVNDRDWEEAAAQFARGEFKERKKEVSPPTLLEFVIAVGPDKRQLRQEIEKVSLYVGDRVQVESSDVNAVVTRNKQARAFALGDALGDRDVRALLKCLDQELWEASLDKKKSAIGILYGLVFKVRAMLLAKGLEEAKLLRPQRDFYQFKSQLTRVPPERLAEDRRFNPLKLNAFVLYRAMQQAMNYRQEELVDALAQLQQCNQELIYSRMEDKFVLQQALLRIVGTGSKGLA